MRLQFACMFNSNAPHLNVARSTVVVLAGLVNSWMAVDRASSDIPTRMTWSSHSRSNFLRPHLSYVAASHTSRTLYSLNIWSFFQSRWSCEYFELSWGTITVSVPRSTLTGLSVVFTLWFEAPSCRRLVKVKRLESPCRELPHHRHSTSLARTSTSSWCQGLVVFGRS